MYDRLARPTNVLDRIERQTRRIISVFALEEARLLGHNYVGSEHLLLALLSEGAKGAVAALEASGVKHSDAQEQVKLIVGEGSDIFYRDRPRTPRFKVILQAAEAEARALDHAWLDPEHLLLAILRDAQVTQRGQGVAVQVLLRLGVDLTHLRDLVNEELATSEHLTQLPLFASMGIGSNPHDPQSFRRSAAAAAIVNPAACPDEVLRKIEELLSLS